MGHHQGDLVPGWQLYLACVLTTSRQAQMIPAPPDLESSLSYVEEVRQCPST